MIVVASLWSCSSILLRSPMRCESHMIWKDSTPGGFVRAARTLFVFGRFVGSVRCLSEDFGSSLVGTCVWCWDVWS